MHIKNATHLFAFFAFGVLLYRVPALLRSGWLTGVAVLLLIPVMALQLVPQDMAMSYWIGRIVYWIAPIIVTLAVLRYFPRIKSLDAIALYSFTIYLWHPAANAAMRTLMWKLHISNVPTMFVIGLVAGVGIPIIMHKIVMHIPYVRTIIIGRT